MQIRTFWISIALLHVCGLVGAFVLLPDKVAKSAMMVRDTNYTGALRSMESLYSSGDRRRPLLMKLAQLHEERGELERVGEILKTYVRIYPEDVDGHSTLATFFRDNYQPEGYRRELASLMRLQPSKKTFTELLQSYRLSGRYEDEMALIDTWKDSPYIDETGLQRLGLLLQAAGRIDDAISVFENLDDRLTKISPASGTSKFNAGREALFDAQIARNRINEAYRKFLVWSRTLNQDEMQLQLIRKLAATGRGEPVVAALGHTPPPGTEITLASVELLLTQNEIEQARNRLIAWRSANRKPAGSELGRYISLTLAAGDLAAAVDAAFTAGVPSVPRSALKELVKQLVDEQQMPLLYALQREMDEDLFADAPLLAAKLALAEGRIKQAQLYLSQVDLLRLTSQDHSNWLGLVGALKAEPQAYDHLSSLWRDRKLPRTLLPAYADLSRKLGRRDTYNEILAKLGGQFPIQSFN